MKYLSFIGYFLFQVNISTKTFLSNLFAILEYEATKNIAKLRKTVEKEIWGIPPAQVNAFYNPNKNDIGKFYLFLFSVLFLLHLTL